MRKTAKNALLVILAMSVANVAFAADGGSVSAIGAGIAIGVAALGGTLGQGKLVAAAMDAIGRNPSAGKALFTNFIIGLALIESLVILAFVIANKILG